MPPRRQGSGGAVVRQVVVGQLIRVGGGRSLETKMSELCRFVRKVCTNVGVLCTLSAADHIVCPLNACRVVLINRRRRGPYKPATEGWV